MAKNGTKFSSVSVQDSCAELMRSYARRHNRPIWAIAQDAMTLYSRVYDSSVNPKAKDREPAQLGRFSSSGRPPKSSGGCESHQQGKEPAK